MQKIIVRSSQLLGVEDRHPAGAVRDRGALSGPRAREQSVALGSRLRAGQSEGKSLRNLQTAHSPCSNRSRRIRSMGQTYHETLIHKFNGVPLV